MSKLQSVFSDVEIEAVEKIDGSPLTQEEKAELEYAGPKVQVETVFKGKPSERKCPVAMYWVINGVRMAYRGRNEFGPTWLPMPGQDNVTCIEDCFTDAVPQ